MSRIASALGELTDRIIPQIYESEEYQPVSEAGFSRIKFTIHRSQKKIYHVIRFASQTPLYAMTVPVSRVKRYRKATRLKCIGLPIYAHRVKDLAVARELAGFVWAIAQREKLLADR